VRFLTAPRVLTSSLYLKKPESSLALGLMLTVCLLVDAALAFHIRTALNDQGRTLLHHQGTPGPTPIARWVLHDVVGLQVRRMPGQRP
jgi:hypothetical protein